MRQPGASTISRVGWATCRTKQVQTQRNSKRNHQPTPFNSLLLVLNTPTDGIPKRKCTSPWVQCDCKEGYWRALQGGPWFCLPTNWADKKHFWVINSFQMTLNNLYLQRRRSSSTRYEENIEVGVFSAPTCKMHVADFHPSSTRRLL